MVGEFGEIQVMDWGLAKIIRLSELQGEYPVPISDESHTQFGTVLGTPSYMSPEQAQGENVDERPDVFALGSILGMILTGRPAFVGSNPRETIAIAAKGDISEISKALQSSTADADPVK